MSKITIDTVRKSAKKARQYICAYHEIHNGTNVMTAIPKERIEKLRKTSYKSHRTVSMSDIKDLREVFELDFNKKVRDVCGLCSLLLCRVLSLSLRHTSEF